MNKTITKILAIIGAITAVAALIFLFRDKIAKLLEQCKCNKGSCDTDDLEGCVEDAIEAVEDKVEETAEAVEDKAEDLAEDLEDKAKSVD